jgi:hypothetical protein
MTKVLEWCAGGLAVAGWSSISALVIRRVLVARSERRRFEAEERLRPLALSLVAGDTVDLDGLNSHDTEVLLALVGRYGRKLRGKGVAHLAAFFEERGEVERQLGRLRSGRAWERAAAAFALGDIGAAAAAERLRDGLEDRDSGVRSAAARSLGRLGDPTAVEPLVRALAEARIPRSVAGQALLAIGEPALPPLRALLSTPNPEARALAVDLVGFLGDASDSPRIAERLRDSSAEVRARAARALGRLGSREGAAELRTRLDDRIPFVRAAVARALGAVGDADAVPALVRVAQSDGFDPARAAAHAISRLDPTAARAAAARPGAGPHLREAADLLEVNG